MMISTTNGTEWLPVNSDSDSENTPPTSPRFLRNDNDNNAHFSSSDDYTSSSDLSPRASPRKVVKQSGPSRWSRFTALFNREEKQVISDQRSAIQINAAFGAFLNKKAQDGGKFSLRERFNYNCIEYIDAKGVAKFKAFIKIGGFGAIAARKFTEEQKTDLRKQFEFHRALSLATDCFNRFANPSRLSNSPTRADFERAKTAFEKVMDAGNREFTVINQMMNQVTGKHVSNTLVEAQAHYQLTGDNGQVTQDTILSTFNSQSFLDMIDTFRGNGYRPEMSEVEVEKVDNYDGVTTGNVAFDNLMRDSQNVPFYMAYARVYNKIYADSIQKEGLNGSVARMHRQTVKSLQSPSNGEVNNAIDENNEKLFALIKANPKGVVALPFGVDEQVFGEMAQLYSQYADQKAALAKAEKEQAGLRPVFDGAKAAFEDFSDNMSLSYEKLNEVYGKEVDQTLPGATGFLQMRQEIDQANQQATETSEGIAARKAQLEQELDQVRGEKARLEGELGSLDANLISLARRYEESQKIINPYEEFEDQSVEKIKSEQKQKLEEYYTTKEEISKVSLSIVRNGNELTSINNGSHDLCQRLQEINTQRQALIERTVKLTYVQVAELFDKTHHVHVGRLRTEYQEKEMAFKAVESLVGQNDLRLTTVLRQLVEIAETMEATGFIFERDNVTGVELPAFKSEGYKADLKQHMIDANQTTRMLVVQMRQLMKSDDELNAEEATKALKAKKVVAAPVVATQQVEKKAVEWADENEAPPSLVTPFVNNNKK